MEAPKAYILCRFAMHSQLYTSWLGELRMPYEIVTDYPGKWKPPDDAAIIITHMHYRWEEVSALRRIVDENRIPVLILADGILEYRNIFEHPDLAAGSIFQPIMGHKLACIGRGQARIVESWGNIGKCEVVGLPRLDPVLAVPPMPCRTDGALRLMIATANTPAFNESQRQAVIESLMHIKSRLDSNQKVNGRIIEVVWRLTDRLDESLGLPINASRSDLPPLSEVINQSDAVITTPSTVFLESVLKKRPTALLDFHNTPHYVPAAWMINAPKHFNTILSELASPPAAKLLFQNEVLHDQLECLSPATPRLLKLIETMVHCGIQGRKNQSALQFPARILGDDRLGFAVVESGFSLADLYPDNPILANQDVHQLQLELNLAIRRLDESPEEVRRLQQRLDELLSKYEELKQHCSEVQERLANAQTRIAKWKQIAGRVTKEQVPDDNSED